MSESPIEKWSEELEKIRKKIIYKFLKMKNKKVLVIGGSGFLGSNLSIY